MARPKKGSNSIPTEERILKAAEKQFGRLGFERTRLQDIECGRFKEVFWLRPAGHDALQPHY